MCVHENIRGQWLQDIHVTHGRQGLDIFDIFSKTVWRELFLMP